MPVSSWKTRSSVRGLTATRFAICLIGPGSSGSDGEDAAKNEYARFGGEWSFADIDAEGVKHSVPPFRSNKIIIAPNGRFIVMQGPKVTRGVFKLDPSKTPKHFDQTVTDGPAKDMTAACIYELDGDAYKLCGSFREGTSGHVTDHSHTAIGAGVRHE